MAATVQLENKAGEKRWCYSVDAKEILSGDNSAGWKMAGPVKRSGWASPSTNTSERRAAAAVPSMSEQIVSGIVEGLAAASQPPLPAAGLPPEEPVEAFEPIEEDPLDDAAFDPAFDPDPT